MMVHLLSSQNKHLCAYAESAPLSHGTMLTLHCKTNAEVAGGRDYAAHKRRRGSSFSLSLHLSLKILEPLKLRDCLLGQLHNYLLRLDFIIFYYIAANVVKKVAK